MADKQEEQKNDNKINLSDEFQKEIKGRKKSSSWLSIIGVLVVCALVFGALGIGTYEIFFKPEKTDSKSSFEKIESRPADQTKKITETMPAKTTQTTPVKPATTAVPEVYTVVEGDTLSGIAAKYDTTSKALADYNGLADPESVLHIGQQIKIPK